MNEKYDILHISILAGDLSRTGGVRRSDQLKEAVREIGGKTININSRTFSEHQSIFDWIYRGFFCGVVILLCLTHGLRFSVLRELVACWLEVRFKLADMRNPIVYLEINNGISIALLILLKIFNIKYVCFPHNIEFLVPNNAPACFRSAKKSMHAELSGYHGALKIFAISRFDAAILSCRGLHASVFSYFPSKADIDIYSDVRTSKYQEGDVHEYLILGTSNYTPTFISIRDMLEVIRVSDGDYRVSIVGFGTERFSCYASDRIKILGAVSDNDLLDVVRRCTAMLINQKQTTGMLTRIIEMNLCGLPQLVISDYFQAEGLEQYGVRLVALADLDKKELPVVAKFFSKPLSDLLLINARDYTLVQG
ncbi:MAG: hypothetical protein AABY68_05070 [Pseudomonadota bacterium]